MLNIDHILFPTDFSAAALRAADHAILLAQRYEATLHVLHVASPSGSAPRPLGVQEALPASVELPAGLAVTQAQVKSRFAASGILDYAQEQDIDLVVMGTRGQTGLRRVVMGSVAEAVVRRASCPVLTVRERGEETGLAPRAGRVKRLLAPVDFSEASRHSLLYARELAETYGARVDLLHVTSHADLRAGARGAPEGEDVVCEASKASRREREEIHLASMAEGAGLEAAVRVVYSYPHGGILDFARDYDTDLIVIGTHGRSGLERALMGSVAERVIRGAPCPVFTVKSFGRSLLPATGEERASAAPRAPKRGGGRKTPPVAPSGGAKASL